MGASLIFEMSLQYTGFVKMQAGFQIFFLNIFVPAPGKSKNTRFSPPFSTTETGKTLLTALSGSGTDKEPLNLLENNGIGCKVTPDCL